MKTQPVGYSHGIPVCHVFPQTLVIYDSMSTTETIRKFPKLSPIQAIQRKCESWENRVKVPRVGEGLANRASPTLGTLIRFLTPYIFMI